jgi:hypothetical protein
LKKRSIRRSSLHLQKNTVSNRNTRLNKLCSQLRENSMNMRKQKRNVLHMRLNWKHRGKGSALMLRLSPELQLWQ